MLELELQGKPRWWLQVKVPTMNDEPQSSALHHLLNPCLSVRHKLKHRRITQTIRAGEADPSPLTLHQ